MEELRSPITVKNIDVTENIAGKITHFIHLKFTVQQRDMRANFLVTWLGKQKVILGLPWLESENPNVTVVASDEFALL